jgi:hypothetical protein
MTDKSVIEQLAEYRLEQDISFEQLAVRMAAVGYPMRPRALHLLLTNRVRTEPRDRTLYKIRRFLEQVSRPTKRSRRSEGRVA